MFDFKAITPHGAMEEAVGGTRTLAVGAIFLRWGAQVAFDGRQLLRRLLLRRQQRRVLERRGDGRSARGALAAADDERDLLRSEQSGGFQRLARGTVGGLLHLKRFT